MADDTDPTGRRAGPVDDNRRTVLKLLGTSAGISMAGLSGSSTLASRPVRADSHTDPNGEPGVDPQEVSLDLGPGESTTVEKTVTTPEIPPVVDIFLLEDESGSFIDDINALQELAPTIWAEIEATDTDFTMGVGGFRDYDQSFWGSPGDWVYRRTQDLTDDLSEFQAGVDALTASGGGDGPEGYLEALHYIAEDSHGGIDSNGDGDVDDSNDTPTGQGPSWRPEATRIVLLPTDAECHEEGDAGGWPGHQSAIDLDIDETVDALNDAGITVIGLTPGGEGTIACVDRLATETGGTVHPTTATGEDLGDAILAGLRNLPAEITPVADDCDGLSITVDPASETVTSGESATFDETITVDGDPPIDGNEGTLTCGVDWLINGESAGDAFRQTVTVEVCADVVVDLIAGQHDVIGTATVSEDGDEIAVTYDLQGGWRMTENHLHLAADCDDIPQTRSGNPKVGRFDYARAYDPAVQTDTYVIDQTDHGFEDDDVLCIAAHAAVVERDDEDNVVGNETAWGDGTRFTERGNWAMHFDYEVCD